jgi:hypothetical protein
MKAFCTKTHLIVEHEGVRAKVPFGDTSIVSFDESPTSLADDLADLGDVAFDLVDWIVAARESEGAARLKNWLARG